ncbi:MAG: leucine-rich repeat domain-containing protein, partial [Clostridia bacterium]|nr:leucine-rich repeat domain-containing protein [Clostridia bacterium]
MKKSRLNIVITMLFVILMAICLFACGGNNNNSPSKGNENKNTEKEKFRVTFIADDREISSQQYDVGTTQITVPSVPTKDNYNGVWEEYTVNTTKKVDLTIRAIYTPIQYSAIYYVNKSDTPYITIHFDVENPIETQPVYQTEEGEVFGGWYYNNSIAALGVEKIEGIININNSYINKETKTIKIYAGTYQGTPGFEFKYNNGKYLVNAYKGHDETIVLPETYNNTLVQGIQFDNNTSYNFRGKTNINSVVIPNTYTSIQAGLFNGCTNLKKLSTPFVCSEEEPNSQSETIPYLKWIGSFKNLEEIYIDHGIIRQDEFWEQENLKKVTINEAQMNQSAFYGLQNLEQVTILGEVSISQNAFYNCVKLKTISIENITRIGQNAFANCVKLEKVTIPNTATIVDTNAFKNCTSLEELNIAAKTIGEGIIQGCNIESITLLAGVE